MRVGYAVMGIGLALVKWPLFVTHPEPWPLFEGVVACLLTASSRPCHSWRSWALRYPIRLLPILLFECVWKLIWFVSCLRFDGTGQLRSDTTIDWIVLIDIINIFGIAQRSCWL
jgi:hypothetical protein